MAVIKQRENDLFYRNLIRTSDKLFEAILAVVVRTLKTAKLNKISRKFLVSLIEQTPDCDLVIVTKKKTIKLEMMIIRIDPGTEKVIVKITFPFWGTVEEHNLII